MFVLSINKKYNFIMMKEYKLEIDNINSQIKFLASSKGYTMIKLKEKINDLFGKTDGAKNLSNKINFGRLRVSDMAEIAEILGYEIILREVE